MRNIVIAVIVAGCSSAPDVAVPEARPVESGPRWIAIDVDAIGTAQLAARAQLAAMAEGVAIMEVDARELRTLSERMHERHHRCGGFTVHASLEAARAAVVPRLQRAEVTYTLDNADAVGALLPAVSEANLLTVIQQLSAMPSRYYTSTSGIAAAPWLRDTWRGYAAARPDVTVELFAHDWPQHSVIATIPGTTYPDEVVVIGGHLDSISPGGGEAPGADDDASGIATLSEVMRALMVTDFRPQRTVKFMAYAAEEVGLRGSSDIANAFEQDGIAVVGVLQLDMTNYRGSSRDIYLLQDYTSASQNTFVGELIDTYLPGVTWGTTACGYACSDHASWNRAGFRVSMPAESRMSDSNPEIHSPYDTLEVSDNSAAHAVKFARLGAAFVAELAKGAPAPPANMVPTVAITAPTTAAETASIELVGMADDPEDGDLSASIRWSSSKDGDLGAGAVRAVTLSVGTHEITATVTDSSDATASTAMTLTVAAGGGVESNGDSASSGCATGGTTGAGVLVVVVLACRRRRRRAG